MSKALGSRSSSRGGSRADLNNARAENAIIPPPRSESSKSERASLKGNDQITPAAAEQEQTVVVDTPAAPQKNYFNSFKKGSFKRYNKAASGTRNFFQKSPSQLEMNKAGWPRSAAA